MLFHVALCETMQQKLWLVTWNLKCTQIDFQLKVLDLKYKEYLLLSNLAWCEIQTLTHQRSIKSQSKQWLCKAQNQLQASSFLGLYWWMCLGHRVTYSILVMNNTRVTLIIAGVILAQNKPVQTKSARIVLYY